MQTSAPPIMKIEHYSHFNSGFLNYTFSRSFFRATRADSEIGDPRKAEIDS